MKRATQKHSDRFRPLIEALDAGYQFWHRDMLRWMTSRGLEVMGLPAWEKIPDDAREQVDDALRIYDQLVAEQPIGADILGTVYMQLVSRWGRDVLAQFFTPGTVARSLALMNLANAEDGPRPGGGLWRLLEPAAGSGVMLLSAMNVIAEQHGKGALCWWSFTAIDLDALCARMTALQVLANCAVHEAPLGELVVYQGNALGPLDELRVVVRATAPAQSAEPLATLAKAA